MRLKLIVVLSESIGQRPHRIPHCLCHASALRWMRGARTQPSVLPVMIKHGLLEPQVASGAGNRYNGRMFPEVKSLTLRLRYLLIHRFRHVVSGSEMEFSDAIVAVLGKNGTGKTNLLELLAAIWTWDFSAFGEESVHVQYRFAARCSDGREGNVEVELRNEQAHPPITGLPQRTLIWREWCKIQLTDLVESQSPWILQIEDGIVNLNGVEQSVALITSMFGKSGVWRPGNTFLISSIVGLPLEFANIII